MLYGNTPRKMYSRQHISAPSMSSIAFYYSTTYELQSQIISTKYAYERRCSILQTIYCSR